jgi:nicotinamidase-related amidase
MKATLLLIDLQNAYFPVGRMALEGSVEASLRAQALLTAFRSKQWPVVHIQHISTRPGATFFLPDTDGALIHPSVAPLPGEPVMQKNFPNAFRATPLLENLKESGTQRLVICGAMTHMCVDSTVRAAFDLGFECTVVADACATRELKFGTDTIPARTVHAAYLAALGPMFATVATADDVLTRLR